MKNDGRSELLPSHNATKISNLLHEYYLVSFSSIFVKFSMLFINRRLGLHKVIYIQSAIFISRPLHPSRCFQEFQRSFLRPQEKNSKMTFYSNFSQNNDCTWLFSVKINDICATFLYGLLYISFPMWKLFIWDIISGICGLGNFQFSAELNICEIENHFFQNNAQLTIIWF